MSSCWVRPAWQTEPVPTLPSAKSPFGRTILIIGKEPLLTERAAEDVRRRAFEESGPDVPDLTDVEGETVDGSDLVEMTGGSLFASRSLAIIRNVGELSPDLFEAVVGLATDTPEEVALVLIHNGGQKGSGLLTKLKQAKVEVIDVGEVKPWEMPQFAIAEAKRHGMRLEVSAAQALVSALGNDLRAVAGAVEQLVADSPGELSAAFIRRYFAGRSDVTSFAVVDETMNGNVAGALEKLRWALSTGVSPVLITSAFAGSLRTLAKYHGERDNFRGSQDTLAKAIGVPSWKLKDVTKQARTWDEQRVAVGIAALARADAEIKGAAAAADFVLERLVLTLARRS